MAKMSTQWKLFDLLFRPEVDEGYGWVNLIGNEKGQAVIAQLFPGTPIEWYNFEFMPKKFKGCTVNIAAMSDRNKATKLPMLGRMVDDAIDTANVHDLEFNGVPEDVRRGTAKDVALVMKTGIAAINAGARVVVRYENTNGDLMYCPLKLMAPIEA